MKSSKEILNFDKLVNLFFLFVLGTISLIVYEFFIFPEFSWKSGLRFAILMIGVLTYEFVVITLISHYVAKAKKKVADYWVKNPKSIYILTTTILGLTYLILNTLIEKSMLIFFRDLVMVLLIIIAMPFVSDFFNKKKENETTNKIQAN